MTKNFIRKYFYISLFFLIITQSAIAQNIEILKYQYSVENDTIPLDIKIFTSKDSLNFELKVAANSFGSYVGSFNGVTAYSNESTGFVSNQYNYYSGTNTGMKWQCVEYTQRYYLQIYGIDIKPYMGHANSFYSSDTEGNLTPYPNDGLNTPQVGDIVCSNGGSWGHVAIVREVNTNYIRVIHQNWSNSSSDNSMYLSRSGNTINPFNSSYPIVGWIRKSSQSSSLTVTNPQAGWTWNYASRVKVEWDHLGYTGNIAIDIYKGGEAPHQNQIRIVSSVPVTQGEVSFDLPTSLQLGTDYKIGISATPSGDPWAFSDFFAIRRLTVTSPNGGQTFNPLQVVNVKWSYDVVTDNVAIDLYKSDVNQHRLVSSTSVYDGNENIIIPSSITAGSDYRIAISAHGGYVYDFSDSYFTISSSPTISRSPTSLSNSCVQGSNASSQNFEVWNSGGGTLSYTISDNVSWLFCSPTSGTSTGEHDNISINYSTSGLSAGTYNATVTISASGVTNSPQTIPVTITVVQNPTHFIFTTTDENYSIVINAATLDGASLEAGDEIGVFTSNGLCVGASVYNDNLPIGLTAWADDNQTSEIDGYISGDTMTFCIWDTSDNKEYTALANYTFGDSVFGSCPYCIVNLEVIHTSIDFSDNEISSSFLLVQNYPNPFNPSTTISYDLPEALNVTLRIFDLNSKEIFSINNEQDAGHYEIMFDPAVCGLSTGVYIYSLQAGDFVDTKKMVFMK